MIDKQYDVLYIGNYTKDTILSPTGTRYVDGGAVNYAAHAAVRLGLRVAVVTHLAKEDSRVVDKFMESGIDCYATFTPFSTLMRLEYPTTNPDIRNLSVEHTAGTITRDEVTHLNAKSAVIGSSLRGEVGLDVIQACKAKGMLVAADMQGYVRVLENDQLLYRPWDEMQEVLSYLDFLKSDMVEAEFLTGETDVLRAAQYYANMGPREIVLTHKDGVLILADGKPYEYTFHPTQLIGRSGRGDTCLGSYVAMRSSKDPQEAGKWAAAVTSLKMEKVGPFDRTMDEVEALIKSRYNHGSV